ncbi:CBASS cGAMP-activated phospholipase [Candidatus Palauibacter sp.]|uniref:CBASS cGAMP-activated phospholipase n=1 Tax=Candidatus Palauibacter sp. TaxID=3101350 RepID=UPI003B5A4E4D
MNAIRVLTLDGGGMRGLYTATVLRSLASRFAASRQTDQLDVGKGFDLAVGTSTGAILAAAIAAGVPLDRVTALYEGAGPRIFVEPIPRYDNSSRLRRVRFLRWAFRHRNRPANSNAVLKSELQRIFGNETFGQVYSRRGIGLCVSATGFLQHHPRVFKTAHLEKKDRDDGLKLADACLASSAAPIYLPLASITADDQPDQVYADGGLWVNNPVLMGLIEGLAVSKPEQRVVILSVGTCPPTPGSRPSEDMDLGIIGWRAGVLPIQLAMNTQSRAATYAATLLGAELRRLGKRISILRCEQTSPSEDYTDLLQLDSASEQALSLMRSLGNEDAQQTYRWCQLEDDERGRWLTEIFHRMPEVDRTSNTRPERKTQDEELR